MATFCHNCGTPISTWPGRNAAKWHKAHGAKGNVPLCSKCSPSWNSSNPATVRIVRPDGLGLCPTCQTWNDFSRLNREEKLCTIKCFGCGLLLNGKRFNLERGEKDPNTGVPTLEKMPILKAKAPSTKKPNCPKCGSNTAVSVPCNMDEGCGYKGACPCNDRFCKPAGRMHTHWCESCQLCFDAPGWVRETRGASKPVGEVSSKTAKKGAVEVVTVCNKSNDLKVKVWDDGDRTLFMEVVSQARRYRDFEGFSENLVVRGRDIRVRVASAYYPEISSSMGEFRAYINGHDRDKDGTVAKKTYESSEDCKFFKSVLLAAIQACP